MGIKFHKNIWRISPGKAFEDEYDKKKRREETHQKKPTSVQSKPYSNVIV